MKWLLKSTGGWVSDNGLWSIRGPIFGKPVYWLYYRNSRYTPTGKYEDSVNFPSTIKAKLFVAALLAKETR